MALAALPCLLDSWILESSVACDGSQQCADLLVLFILSLGWTGRSIATGKWRLAVS